MYWYFEAVRAPAGHVAADQRRVVRVAGADTTRLQVRMGFVTCKVGFGILRRFNKPK